MTKHISLTLLTVAAVFSMGCEHKRQVQRCVDDQGRVVPDGQCDHPHTVGFYGPYPYYRWYYGGRGYVPNDMATGGSFEPAVGVESVRA